MRYLHTGALTSYGAEDASGNATSTVTTGLRCLVVDITYEERLTADGSLSRDTALVFISPEGYRTEWTPKPGDSLAVSGQGISARTLRVSYAEAAGAPGRVHHVEVRGAD